MSKILLATASPARRQLFSNLNIPFDTYTSNIDEHAHSCELPYDYVQRIALEKAKHARQYNPHDIIITADTIIEFNDQIIGKPKDYKHAKQLLIAFSGQTHRVLTAMVIMQNDEITTRTEISNVTFRSLSDRLINWYLDTGEWQHRAGAYAIQGNAMSLIKSINGCISSIIGLPMPVLTDYLFREC